MFCLMIFAAVFPLSQLAAVPQVRTPGPGFFRHILGDFEITALHDGIIPSSVERSMPSIPKEELTQALQRAFIPFPVTATVNALLINTNAHLVLIDTGAGALLGNCCGHLLPHLRAAGYHPEQVDLVLLTHLHADLTAAGLLTVNGSMAFPNAVLRTSKPEVDYWLNVTGQLGSDDEVKKRYDWAKTALAPYQAANQFSTFSNHDKELVPGIRPIIRLGHTPGHTVFFIESRGQTLVAWGDTLHVGAVQFANPLATLIFDYDEAEARKARLDLMRLAAEKKYLVAGSRIAFPGIGHLRAVGNATVDSYVWVPVLYDSDPTRPKAANFST